MACSKNHYLFFLVYSLSLPKRESTQSTPKMNVPSIVDTNSVKNTFSPLS